MESPLNDPNGQLVAILSSIDIGTTVLFALEILLKVIAYGFALNGEHSFLQSTSNCLDFTVTSLSVNDFSLLTLTCFFRYFQQL